MKISEVGTIKAELSMMDIQWLQKFVYEIELPNCYVEIGTREGGSALFARLANKDVEIYTIDPKPLFNCWKIRPEEIKIISITGCSLREANKWSKPIGVLFIDGNHKKAQGPMAKDDFYAWEKFVVKGGVIIFHDYSDHPLWADVRKDCDDVIEENKDKYMVVFKPDFNNPIHCASSSITLHTSFVILKKK